MFPAVLAGTSASRQPIGRTAAHLLVFARLAARRLVAVFTPGIRRQPPLASVANAMSADSRLLSYYRYYYYSNTTRIGLVARSMCHLKGSRILCHHPVQYYGIRRLSRQHV